ncbi:MAG TPA: hypothetical protein VI893_07820 [Thermoplasmata archaeon]|nr:hypothetical protein [Thermoplasmata archaeon]
MEEAEGRLLVLLSKAFLNTRYAYPAQSLLFARAMLMVIEGLPGRHGTRGAGFRPAVTS